MNHSHQRPAVATTCPYCGVGCGVLATADGKGGAEIAGDPLHPSNFGKLCSKGAALGDTVSLGGRLLHPMRRDRSGELVRVGWDDALDNVAASFRSIVDRHGPDSIALYLSGQLLTEDYYVANKLMKGFIGSANVDTNSRLCMASSVAGHRRAFGSDTVPGTYEDIDTADLIVLVGSNAAWCHPVLFQRMMKNRAERGARIVVIDPRRTATAEDADLFLPVAPGTDTALFCGLLVDLADNAVLENGYIAAHTRGFETALATARKIAPDVHATALATGLAEANVAAFFALFRDTPRVVTCYSQGVNQSAQGTDKVNAILNCHLATGRIGKCGCGPFSLTGQPNAMGGREVGGLANQLAAHMGFAPDDVDRVGRFWTASRMASREGRKAVDMFEAVAHGEIKALWVMATNPAASLPRASAMREGLKKLELFVVSENVLSNDTVNAGAHLLLPAAAWGEKDGTVTNSERRISRQRAFLPLPGEAKPDWWIVAEVARRMGFGAAFDFHSAADVFREHAALSAFENDGRRDFNLGGVAALTDEAFDAMAPFQWPLREGEKADETRKDQRFFADGRFYTPDKKAVFVAPEAPALRESLTGEFPLRLNTGRIRDQWHTMTRTGKSPRLGAHMSEPFVEVHPDDAREAGLEDGRYARVSTAHGAVVLKVAVSEGQRRGSLFVPIHWSGETASCACVGDLVSSQTDPVSGQPEAKATPVAIVPVAYLLQGVARARHPLPLPEETWWARVTVAEGTEYRLATGKGPMVWHDFAYRTLGGSVADALEGPEYRAAAFVEGELEAYLCLGPLGEPLHPHDVSSLLPPDGAGESGRMAQMRGMAHEILSTEPIVCACFGVTFDAVRQVVSGSGRPTVEDVARELKAGTNCGSCLPELKRMIARERVAHAL